MFFVVEERPWKGRFGGLYLQSSDYSTSEFRCRWAAHKLRCFFWTRKAAERWLQWYLKETGGNTPEHYRVTSSLWAFLMALFSGYHTAEERYSR